ncbi:ATPase [Bacillus fungorum]|uniref:ATPase n=1 Tax=Bacillus fungorum TaxID=2039284 RepID=A0A2G6QFG5_9BACI|nr:TniB family NTP-binding protein [Bacillus fungorum]PIE95582.1 ATPase [Bacillus fungorum]
MYQNNEFNISIKEELERFKNLRILHPKMEELLIKLKTLIELPGGNEIIILMGPSGVGKSTLIEELQKRIIKSLIKELEENKSKLPLVTVELVSPDSGLFNWKDFYIRTLEVMHEPLIHNKILYKTNEEQNSNKRLVRSHSPRTAPELRKSIENAFYYREPKVFIIDEAQHFTKMASGKRFKDQLDTLKSLSNLTQIPQLLVGTYELKDFVNLNGQLARRTMDVHFSRYDINIDNDLNNYIGIINGLLGRIPIQVSNEIINEYEYLYERTLGCVGILKDWLVRALKISLEENSDVFTLQHLERTALSINKISKLLDEIMLGESLFIERKETIKEIRNKLGIAVEPSSVNKGTRARGVGVRKPIRDKVGRELQ